MASLKRNVIANYVGRSWTAVLGIILVPVYIKFIGIEAYGLVGFFATLTSVIGILDLGIGSTMNREMARRSANPELEDSQRDLVRSLEIIYWVIAIISGAIVIVGAPFISNTWINNEELSSKTVLLAVQLMAISVALRFPMSLYQGGLMGLQKHVLVNIILVANGTLRGIGAIFVLWFISPTITAYFAWQAIISLTGSITFLIAMWVNLPKANKKGRFKWKIIQEIWRYAGAISANAVIGIFLSQLDKVVLSKMLPLKMFAYYSIATTVASSIWMIIIPFNTALFPKLVQLYESKKIEELKKLFHQSSQVLSFILLPICSILIFYSRDLLLIWLQDPIVVENTYLIMSLLIFGIMLNGLASLPANCAPAFGWPMLMTYTNLIQAIFIIPLVIAMVYWLQGVGAAIAWIIMNSTYIIFMAPVFFKRFLIEEQKKWYIQDIIPPFIISLSICLISLQFMPETDSIYLAIIWILAIGLLTMIVVGFSLNSIRSYFQQVLNHIKR